MEVFFFQNPNETKVSFFSAIIFFASEKFSTSVLDAILYLRKLYFFIISRASLVNIENIGSIS